MITTTSPSYYTITASGEAAELITQIFSPGSTYDITNVVVRSKEYAHDIEPMSEADTAIDIIQTGLGTAVTKTSKMNPLFVPMGREELEELIESDDKGENIVFMGMEGNPFAVKVTALETDDERILFGSVSYNRFELPNYEEIMSKQKSFLVN